MFREIKEVLAQLLVQPKQATERIQLMSMQSDNFMADLATTVLEETDQPMIIRAGLTSFNVLAVRALDYLTIQDYYMLDQIYENLKRLIFSRSLSIK